METQEGIAGASSSELKVTYMALKTFLNDFGHDEYDVQRPARLVMVRVGPAEGIPRRSTRAAARAPAEPYVASNGRRRPSCSTAGADPRAGQSSACGLRRRGRSSPTTQSTAPTMIRMIPNRGARKSVLSSSRAWSSRTIPAMINGASGCCRFHLDGTAFPLSWASGMPHENPLGARGA